MTQSVPSCPECGSTKTWKDGTRKTEYGKINDTIAKCAVTGSAKPSQTNTTSLKMFKLSIDCHKIQLLAYFLITKSAPLRSWKRKIWSKWKPEQKTGLREPQSYPNLN